MGKNCEGTSNDNSVVVDQKWSGQFWVDIDKYVDGETDGVRCYGCPNCYIRNDFWKENGKECESLTQANKQKLTALLKQVETDVDKEVRSCLVSAQLA